MELRMLIGAHRTGLEHLRTQLEANADLLAHHGTILPQKVRAGNARQTLLKAVRKNKTTESTGKDFLHHLTEGRNPERVLIIDPEIAGSMLRPHKNGIYYPRASATTFQMLRELEGLCQVRLYFVTRNTASLLPSCYGASLRHQPNVGYGEFTASSEPDDLRWSELLHRLQGSEAEVPVTVWAYEDYPRMWRQVAQAFSGVPNKELFQDAGTTILNEFSLRGATLLFQYLQDQPAKSGDWDKIETKFIERFPWTADTSLDDHWPKDLVAALGDAYDDDNYYIDRMDNLVTIRPPVYL